MARAAQRAGARGTVFAIQRWGAATRQLEATIRSGSPATILRWVGHYTTTRARPGRACAHAGHAGWVSWASLGFGEPDSL